MIHATFSNRGSEIHYWHRASTGDKYVLFFHGAGLDHRMFESQLEAFDDSYNLIFWDARAHGLSKLTAGQKFTFDDMVSDCLKLYEVLGIDSAIIVGQSMGGNLAQRIAYEHSELVEKLVLIGCANNAAKVSLADKLSLAMAAPLLRTVPWKTLVEQFAIVCSNKEEVRNYVRECFARIDKASFMDVFTAVTTSLHEDADFRFKQPVLLLVGAGDKSGNVLKIAPSWAKSDDSIDLHIIKDAAHNVNQDQPEKVNSLIKDFVS